ASPSECCLHFLSFIFKYKFTKNCLLSRLAFVMELSFFDEISLFRIANCKGKPILQRIRSILTLLIQCQKTNLYILSNLWFFLNNTENRLFAGIFWRITLSH